MTGTEAASTCACRSRALLAPVSALPRVAAVKVVTTTEDLASLAREVGGDKVAVDALAKGYQDPHFVEPSRASSSS